MSATQKAFFTTQPQNEKSANRLRSVLLSKIQSGRESKVEEAETKYRYNIKKKRHSLSGKTKESSFNANLKHIDEIKGASRLCENDFNYYFCNICDVITDIDEVQYIRDFIKIRESSELKQKETFISNIFEAWMRKNGYLRERINFYKRAWLDRAKVGKCEVPKGIPSQRRLKNGIVEPNKSFEIEHSDNNNNNDPLNFVENTALNTYLYDSGELNSVNFIFHSQNPKQKIERIIKRETTEPIDDGKNRKKSTSQKQVPKERDLNASEKTEAAAKSQELMLLKRRKNSTTRPKTSFFEESHKRSPVPVPIVCFNNVLKKTEGNFQIKLLQGYSPKSNKDTAISTRKSPAGLIFRKTIATPSTNPDIQKREEEHIMNYFKMLEKKKDDRPQLGGLGPLETLLLKTNTKLKLSNVKLQGSSLRSSPKKGANNITSRGSDIIEGLKSQPPSRNMAEAQLKALRCYRKLCRMVPFLLRIHFLRNKTNSTQAKIELAKHFRQNAHFRSPTLVDNRVMKAYETYFEFEQHHGDTGQLLRYVISPNARHMDRGFSYLEDKKYGGKSEFLKSFYKGDRPNY